MKRTKVVGVSVLITLAMVFSTFSITALNELCSENNNEYHGELEVVKEVFDGENWTNETIEANLGETLQFRINLTYYNKSSDPHYAHNIRVNDTLPECLNYENGSADPEEDKWSDDDPNEYLYWNFGDKKLNDTESLIIKYNATVVNITDEKGQENNVTVNWDEHCTGWEGLVEDALTIIVKAEPQINVQKEVWDPVKHEYVKNIITYPGEILRFKINVSNSGFDNLTGVTLNDTYPEFLTPIEYSETPLLVDPLNMSIIWDLGTITAHNSSVILFNATVNSVEKKTTGKNFANVTCDQDLNDSDNVTITVKKHFIIEKKVKHPDTGEWVDEIPYVKGCEPVRFRINATYYGDPNVTMKCLLIYDQLPVECLEYSDNVYIEIAGVVIDPSDEYFYPDIYTENDTFMLCGSPVGVPEGGVYFSWINPLIGLEDGESVVIEFDASVIEYCECEGKDCCKMENCAEGWLWSCCEHIYQAYDCVNITCIALPGEFNKTVWDPDANEWVEELHTVQGFTVRFKLELTHYGNENLTNLTFIDTLPCCLEYAGNSNIPPTDVSADKKKIWWNISQNVSDCETFSIEFDAKVTGPSECGGCINHAHVYGYIWQYCDVYKTVVNRSDAATVYAEANSPPSRPDVDGPEQGIVGISLTYNAMLDDPDGDQIYYKFDWGLGNGETSWLGPVSPGEVTESHTYSTAGTYTIKAKAKDEHDAESGWTQYPVTVEIKTAEVNLSLSMFNFGSVKATVTNSGDADLSNIHWEFNISRDKLLDFRDINIDGNGTISTLLSGGSETISSESVGFTRLGLADVNVTVSKPGVIEPKSVTARAFFLGSIVITF